MRRDTYLGINIGGTRCSIVLGDSDLRMIDKKGFDTKTERGWENIMRELITTAHGILGKNKIAELRKIGISCGGPLDSRLGMILSPPNLPGWDEVPIGQIFKDEFGTEAVLQNDANASALAEWLMGAGKGSRNMIFLTFGTGMGAGIILDGKLYSGTNDLGGEVGHIRLAENGPAGYGKEGSFEGFCSGGGIARLAKSMIYEKIKKKEVVAFCPDNDSVQNLDARTVVRAAISGDPAALEIIGIVAEYLGRGLAILIDILNPDCIVIGSIYARNEFLFKPLIEKVLQRETLPAALKVCRIKPAGLGDSVGDYAALCVAIYEDKF